MEQPNSENLFETIKRASVDIFSADTLRERLFSGKPQKIKLGADPSRPDLHLGHSVPLRILRKLQDAGHEVIFVVGDFTGMIGDPSGRSKTRAQLTFEETRENGRSYFEQVSKIIDTSKARVVYNSEWLGKLSFGEVLNLAGKYTLARILERDDFAGRFANNKPIGLHELLYPLMQGYDSVALKADIEIGGTDQTFNLLVGRELQKDYGQTRQEVITFPLLPGLDGVNKMSKSLDNYIGIGENAEIIFEKCMKVPDGILETYFKLTTDIPEREYTNLIEKDIRQAHFAYAREIVRMYHSNEAADSAHERYLKVASGKTPDDISEIFISADGDLLTNVIKQAGFAPSNSAARRLIEGGGIKIDGITVRDSFMRVSGDFVLGCGKNKFVRVRCDFNNSP
ncbi:MAG: tyrosine--tRNA ligase [Clostridiales bacterium]|jgi:tyrosyl-tRNA synthetase|nr:tyrosine--tRNA ligase [Clostridiales bacterium]